MIWGTSISLKVDAVELGDDPSDLCQEKMGTSEWEGGFQTADRNAFTVSPDLRIQVSDRAHGTHGFAEWLGAYHGKRHLK
jgi:hypothetical protein